MSTPPPAPGTNDILPYLKVVPFKLTTRLSMPLVTLPVQLDMIGETVISATIPVEALDPHVPYLQHVIPVLLVPPCVTSRISDRLTCEAEQILSGVNAGGKSIRSEAYAMQVLSTSFGAKGIETEMEINYFNRWWKKCDFITTIGDERYGVSVTRAAFSDRFRDHNPDDIDLKVSNLLQKKLSGLVIARAGIGDEFVFRRAVLFVWSPDRITSLLLLSTFNYLTEYSLRDDVSLIIAELTDDNTNNVTTTINNSTTNNFGGSIPNKPVRSVDELLNDFPSGQVPSSVVLYTNICSYTNSCSPEYLPI